MEQFHSPPASFLISLPGQPIVSRISICKQCFGFAELVIQIRVSTKQVPRSEALEVTLKGMKFPFLRVPNVCKQSCWTLSLVQKGIPVEYLPGRDDYHEYPLVRACHPPAGIAVVACILPAQHVNRFATFIAGQNVSVRFDVSSLSTEIDQCRTVKLVLR